MSDPKTVAEQLDAAKNGNEFGLAVLGFFAALDKARWAEEDTDDD
jgi:hypothetical protein